MSWMLVVCVLLSMIMSFTMPRVLSSRAMCVITSMQASAATMELQVLKAAMHHRHAHAAEDRAAHFGALARQHQAAANMFRDDAGAAAVSMQTQEQHLQALEAVLHQLRAGRSASFLLLAWSKEADDADSKHQAAQVMLEEAAARVRQAEESEYLLQEEELQAETRGDSKAAEQARAEHVAACMRTASLTAELHCAKQSAEQLAAVSAHLHQRQEQAQIERSRLDVLHNLMESECKLLAAARVAQSSATAAHQRCSVLETDQAQLQPEAEECAGRITALRQSAVDLASSDKHVEAASCLRQAAAAERQAKHIHSSMFSNSSQLKQALAQHEKEDDTAATLKQQAASIRATRSHMQQATLCTSCIMASEGQLAKAKVSTAEVCTHVSVFGRSRW